MAQQRQTGHKKGLPCEGEESFSLFPKFYIEIKFYECHFHVQGRTPGGMAVESADELITKELTPAVFGLLANK